MGVHFDWDNNEQKTMMGGLGGAGRKLKAGYEDIKEKIHELEEMIDEELYWAQMVKPSMGKRTLKGGHGVPLSRCVIPCWSCLYC